MKNLGLHVPVASPPFKGVGKRLESLTRKALHQFEMLEGANKVAVALSGGKDSLALLYLLKGILGYGFPALELHAIHVAGEFSCGAGVKGGYLQAICDALGVPLETRSSEQKLETLECYSCSRERRRLLFEAAKSVGANTIAFGHHQDDNAQTLLMNLFQKGEFAGALPKLEMVHFGVTIIRPLTFACEQDIRTFATEYGFHRVTCRCPVGQNSMRKKVEAFIAEVEEYFPHVRNNLSHSALMYGSDKAKRP